jgi:hypothetical protein
LLDPPYLSIKPHKASLVHIYVIYVTDLLTGF